MVPKSGAKQSKKHKTLPSGFNTKAPAGFHILPGLMMQTARIVALKGVFCAELTFYAKFPLILFTFVKKIAI
jgi:hypothetical protein